MVLHDNKVFIHIPKTGGTSISEFLIESLGLEMKTRTHRPADAWKHITIRQLRSRQAELDIDVLKLDKIITMFRNPYDRMVSLYYFYRQYRPDWFSRTGVSSEISFLEWCRVVKNGKFKHPWAGYDHFVLLDGKMPDNLEILFYENYDNEIARIADIFGCTKMPEVKHVFKTKRPPWESVVNEEAEGIIYSMNQWAFDSGYYGRAASCPA